VSDPIRRLSPLQSPVFLVNSRHRLLAATHFGFSCKNLHLMWAPLIPKLRGQIAEFLGRSSLTRLSILYSPTCVRFRYGHPTFIATRLFLEVWAQSLYGAYAPRTRFSGFMKKRVYLSLPPTSLNRAIQYPADLPSFVTPSLQLGGTGILTRFPSATPLGLTLGPDLPWADEPSPGTLGLTARWILTTFIATHAGILTSQKSRPSFDNPSTLWERSPTNP
jgi:hypothetical protein